MVIFKTEEGRNSTRRVTLKPYVRLCAYIRVHSSYLLMGTSALRKTEKAAQVFHHKDKEAADMPPINSASGSYTVAPLPAASGQHGPMYRTGIPFRTFFREGRFHPSPYNTRCSQESPHPPQQTDRVPRPDIDGQRASTSSPHK